MKKILTAALFLFSAGAVFSQKINIDELYKIPIKTAEDCKKAEPEILKAANYVLSKPLDDNDGVMAGAFILLWATGSEHSFTFDGNISNLSKHKKNTMLLCVYLAATAKYILENPDKEKDTKAVTVYTYNTLASYIGNVANRVKKTKHTKKLIAAKTNNTMAAYCGY